MASAGADLEALRRYVGTARSIRDRLPAPLDAAMIALMRAQHADPDGYLGRVAAPLGEVAALLSRLAVVDDHPGTVADAFERADGTIVYGVTYLTTDPDIPVLDGAELRALGAASATGLARLLEEVDDGRHDAIVEAAETHLAELARIGALLEVRGGEAAFAEAFVDALGADGVERALLLLQGVGLLEQYGDGGHLPDHTRTDASAVLGDGLFLTIATASGTRGGRDALLDVIDRATGEDASVADRLHAGRLAHVPGLADDVLVALATGVLVDDAPFHEGSFAGGSAGGLVFPLIEGRVEIAVLRALAEDPAAARTFVAGDSRALASVLDPTPASVHELRDGELRAALAAVLDGAFAGAAPQDAVVEHLLDTAERGQLGPHGLELPAAAILAPRLAPLLAGEATLHSGRAFTARHDLEPVLVGLLRDLDEGERVAVTAVVVEVSGRTAVLRLDATDLVGSRSEARQVATSSVSEVLGAAGGALAEVLDDEVRAQEEVAAALRTLVGHAETVVTIVAPNPVTVGGRLAAEGAGVGLTGLADAAVHQLVVTTDRVDVDRLADDLATGGADAFGRAIWHDPQLRAAAIAAENAHRDEVGIPDPFAPRSYDEFVAGDIVPGLLDEVHDETIGVVVDETWIAERDR